MKKIFLIFFVLLIFIGAVLELMNLLNGVPKDRAIAIGYFSAFFYTLIFGLILQKPLGKFFEGFSNIRYTFTIIGTIGAIFIETIIWGAQTFLSTTGAAISPNLLIDLIMTVPFYILLCYFLYPVVQKNNFPWIIIAISGGFYELVADGIVGNLFQLNLLGALIAPLLLPVFVMTYSPIILVPFLMLPKPPLSSSRQYLALIKPLKSALVLPFSIGIGLFLSQILK